jgi:hypothetical protein
MPSGLESFVEHVVPLPSLHCMDWERVLPKLRRCLPGGPLAIVDARQCVGLARARALQSLIATCSTNRDYQAYDFGRGADASRAVWERGRRVLTTASYRQSWDAYVESFQSRNGSTHARMGEAAAQFDRLVVEWVLQHRSDVVVEGLLAVRLVWGDIMA